MQHDSRTRSEQWFALLFGALLMLALLAPLVSERSAWAQEEKPPQLR